MDSVSVQRPHLAAPPLSPPPSWPFRNVRAWLLTATLACVVTLSVLQNSLSSSSTFRGHGLWKRESETDPGDEDDGSTESEVLSSWAIFISISLLIVAFIVSYLLQAKRIQAIHETVISIFAGMTVGLFLLVTPGDDVRNIIKFNPQIFFNLLLPPIILSSGYELHQANFFRHIGVILTFAFAGTFLSAVAISLLLWLYTLLPGTMDFDFVDAISVGATLSATDPVTILAIFNSYQVDPKLYTVIFGESILNDAIAIVLFETAQSYKKGEAGELSTLHFFKGIGVFLLVFFGSLLMGVLVGVATALLLKLTHIRRFAKIESSLVVLIAYASYFFSNGVHLSGIVSLLFCGITLKHYAYYNMSRRTQLTTKYLFQVLAQLSENFIFIYLGLALFTDNSLVFQPPLILVTVLAVCAARWVAVFPLSRLINRFLRYRAGKRGGDVSREELPYSYQAMLFWAGLRGAVGVALAALMEGENAPAMRATVLVVVVLTVIIFGGTTARMLEILGIPTGVTEDDAESDDEFDTELYHHVSGGSRTLPLSPLGGGGGGHGRVKSGSGIVHAAERATLLGGGAAHTSSSSSRASLLTASGSTSPDDFGSDVDTSDLPPPPRRSALGTGSLAQESTPNLSSTLVARSPSRSEASRHDRGQPPGQQPGQQSGPQRDRSGSRPGSTTMLAAAASDAALSSTASLTASTSAAAGHGMAAIRSLLTTDDPGSLFRQLDEDYIKPTLLLDNRPRSGHGPGGPGNGPGNV